MGTMRKFLAWLGAATLFVLTSVRADAANDVLKPYVVLILDTSGSMLISTGSGPTSCGKQDNRINHAVCAINNIVNSYGDMVFSLARFRENTATNGTFSTCDGNGNQDGNPGATIPNPTGGDQCGTQGAYCGDCVPSTGVAKSCAGNGDCSGGDTCVSGKCSGNGVCTTADRNFEVLTPLVDGNNATAALYTNGSCGTCSMLATASDPEIWGVSQYTFTPLSAVLNGDKTYWTGNQASDGTVIWPSNQAGYDPINRDPSNNVFLPTGCNPSKTCTTNCCATQCRPYITILLTDGDETCTQFSNTTASAAALLNTTPRNDAVSISSLARSAAGVVTVTTSSAHPFAVGDTVQVFGVTLDNTFNGTFVVTAVPMATQAQWNQAGSVSNIGSGGSIRHVGFNNKYRVETKVIGFGLTPGNANIEAIAHAGNGGIDVPGVNEGYYAQDEADIELAISQILADSVRSEACNNLDDDCDTRVDEDFPTKGGTCTNGQVGECARTGTLVCSADGTGLTCNAVTVTPGSEGTVCNQKDDDCDGRVDEGLTCTSCVPVGETCNNKDDDCDGNIDEGLTRACGTGVCLGTEVCTNGTWGGCTAQTPSTELCNGKDDDCDGVCDGFQRGCSEVNGACNPANQASCPQTDSPGDPGHYTQPDAAETACADAIDNDLDGLINDGCPANGTAETGAACANALDDDNDGLVNDGCPVPTLPIVQNICRPGQKTCAQLCATSNSFGACSNEVKPCNGQTPCTDPCNGIDDDCDNKIDEDFTPADCSTNCGVGTTQCVNGNITCNSTPATDDTTCNNVDDDCDGKIDEDWTCPNPVNNMCPCGSGMVCDGEQKCVNGQVVCQGGPLSPETCNCNDEDCDGKVDEGTVCPSGSTCTNCQCAFPCAQGEFPCPLGKKCDAGYCVNDPCFQVTCPAVNGNAQTCIPNPQMPNDYQCVDTCSTKTCPTNFVCVGSTGECAPDDCRTFPTRCTSGQSCIVNQSTGFAECVSNPCAGVTCPADKYCLGGTCVGSCADITCPSGQRCRQGMCETDPCGHPCPFGFACNDTTGMCIMDPCKDRNCPQGQWCNPNDGQCEDDPCVVNSITCPNEGELCRGGTCINPDDLRPDAAGEAHVTVGGGGGCSTGGGSTGLLVGLALLFTRRRKRVLVARAGGVQ
jgi:hypothetical protein